MAQNQVFIPRQSIQEGLDHLAQRLNPLISQKLAHVLDGLEWTEILHELDRAKGFSHRQYVVTDLQPQLRMLTERLGNLGHPFDPPGQRIVSTLGNELRIVRNLWAHTSEFDALDAWRVHDFVVRLLEHFNDSGLAKAIELRAQALQAYVSEVGGQPQSLLSTEQILAATASAMHPEPLGAGGDVPEPELVVPDDEVLVRTDDQGSKTIGFDREQFEPWLVVPSGEDQVIEDLPKHAAKAKVRSLAQVIVDFEGPVHRDRLAQLIARSFGLKRLAVRRKEQIIRQIRAAGLEIDADHFVWPPGMIAEQWREFRPNDSTVDRDFEHISPREIANAAAFIANTHPEFSADELQAAVLRTFGRRRCTQQIKKHLSKAMA